MKGMVFTELLGMAEAALGEDIVDEVLDGLELSSGGAYTAVGNYPCSDLINIVAALSARTGVPADELQRQFGHWVFGSFLRSYPQFFTDKASALEMLDAIETEVHVEVRKLYPDAELPTFDTRHIGPGEMQMRYQSDRPLVAFCKGLIEACIDHFQRPVSIAEHAGGTACEAVFVLREGL